MSTAVTESPVATAPTRSPAPDFSKPVARPKTSGWQLFKDVLNHGGPGYLQFAITNICNADCGFCGFARSQFDPKKRHSVTLQEAKDVVDIAKRNHIGYLLFVGGEPMVHRDLRAMVRYSAEQGIHPMICTNGGLWNDDTMKALASCTFSYPLTSLASSYLSFSDSGLVNFNNTELLALFENIKKMKRSSGYPVVNPTESLDEMQRHLRGEKEHFGCLGGHKYFYLDWNLDLYRCHAWDKPMCKVYEWDDTKLIRDGCTKCMIDCYRDPSVLQHVAINASDAWHALKKGDLGTAAMKVLDSKNVTSLKAVWEDRKWIGKV